MNTLKEAIKKAQARSYFHAEKRIIEHGENPTGCGFAWVTVKGARGKKADLLKAHGFTKSYNGPGLILWNPSAHRTQDMDAKFSGAIIYAEELKAVGLNATADCRLD